MTNMTKLGRFLYYKTIAIGKFIVKHPFVYYLLSYTWGIIGTLIGHIISLILLSYGRFRTFYTTYYVELNKPIDSGLEMGTTFSVGKNCGRYLICHEYGHSIQNALFGPFVFILVWMPSVIRFNVRRIKEKMHKHITTGYDDIWFEGSATNLGWYAFDSYYMPSQDCEECCPRCETGE